MKWEERYELWRQFQGLDLNEIIRDAFRAGYIAGYVDELGDVSRQKADTVDDPEENSSQTRG